MIAPDPTAAFEAFYRAEHGRLLRYFRKQVGPDEAPDLMQETFMRLLRSGAFDRIEHPTAYLMRSARNLLIERARRKAREQCIAIPYDEESAVPMQPAQNWRSEEARSEERQGGKKG